MNDRLQVVIDTREQRPWAFDQSRIETSIGTLKTGDYALLNDENFGIERKSLDDFLGTISTGWHRFVREINRMDSQQWVAKVIIVEGEYSSFIFKSSITGEPMPPDHRHVKLSPQFIERRVAELTMRNCSVLFAVNPFISAGLAAAIFKQRNNQLKTDVRETDRTKPG